MGRERRGTKKGGIKRVDEALVKGYDVSGHHETVTFIVVYFSSSNYAMSYFCSASPALSSS